MTLAATKYQEELTNEEEKWSIHEAKVPVQELGGQRGEGAFYQENMVIIILVREFTYSALEVCSLIS